MKTIKLTNLDENFYKILGPVFGSREIERATKDRFYDDSKKVWYLRLNNERKMVAILSIKSKKVANVYATDKEALVELLCEVYDLIDIGTVTTKYKKEYLKAGYCVTEKTKNFCEIMGGNNSGVLIL